MSLDTWSRVHNKGRELTDRRACCGAYVRDASLLGSRHKGQLWLRCCTQAAQATVFSFARPPALHRGQDTCGTVLDPRCSRCRRACEKPASQPLYWYRRMHLLPCVVSANQHGVLAGRAGCSTISRQLSAGFTTHSNTGHSCPAETTSGRTAARASSWNSEGKQAFD